MVVWTGEEHTAHSVVNRPTLAILQLLLKVTGLDFPATPHAKPRTPHTDVQVDTGGGMDVSGGEAGLLILVVVGLKRTSRPRRPRPGVAERKVAEGLEPALPCTVVVGVRQRWTARGLRRQHNTLQGAQ